MTRPRIHMRGSYKPPVLKGHTCDYRVDLDGQVTCAICGAMDDDMEASGR